jgi:hypothetical protein
MALRLVANRFLSDRASAADVDAAIAFWRAAYRKAP